MAGLGGIATGCDTGSGSEAQASQPFVATGSWAGVQAQFALDPKLRHFSAFYLASHPRPVREAIERHRQGLDADPAGYVHENQIGLEGKIVQAAASYLGARAEDFALTDSTTMGLGLLYGGVTVGRGQEILTTEARLLLDAREPAPPSRARRGEDSPRAALRRAGTGIRGRDREPPRRGRTARDAGCRGHLGALGDGREAAHQEDRICLANRRQGDATERLFLCVDAVQALGAEEMRLDELGADFVVAGCHKWLFGPRGPGSSGERTTPGRLVRPRSRPSRTTRSFAWIESRSPSKPTNALTMTPGGFHSFEHR